MLYVLHRFYLMLTNPITAVSDRLLSGLAGLLAAI
jgi:hypothetical protein